MCDEAEALLDDDDDDDDEAEALLDDDDDDDNETVKDAWRRLFLQSPEDHSVLMAEMQATSPLRASVLLPNASKCVVKRSRSM